VAMPCPCAAAASPPACERSYLEVASATKRHTEVQFSDMMELCYAVLPPEKVTEINGLLNGMRCEARKRPAPRSSDEKRCNTVNMLGRIRAIVGAELWEKLRQQLRPHIQQREQAEAARESVLMHKRIITSLYRDLRSLLSEAEWDVCCAVVVENKQRAIPLPEDLILKQFLGTALADRTEVKEKAMARIELWKAQQRRLRPFRSTRTVGDLLPKPSYSCAFKRPCLRRAPSVEVPSVD